MNAAAGGPMFVRTAKLPLPTLLSAAVVAYTIEADNEFERRMPHRTASTCPPPGVKNAPWLCSIVMWFNCLRLVPEEGITIASLMRAARTSTNFDGMRRWGYITIDSPTKKPNPKAVVRLTPAGIQADQVWSEVIPIIDDRWRARFGVSVVDEIASSLRSLVPRPDAGLPDCLPILGYGLSCSGNLTSRFHEIGREAPFPAPLTFPTLLSRPLLAFALEFEAESEVSLAIAANILRVMETGEMRQRDIAIASGLSKEAVAMTVNFLTKKELVTAGAGVTTIVRLTNEGLAVRREFRCRVERIEAGWGQRYGQDVVSRIRASLEPIVGDATPSASRLFEGLTPPRECWRASARHPQTLPHFPAVLHRGGYPDGA